MEPLPVPPPPPPPPPLDPPPELVQLETETTNNASSTLFSRTFLRRSSVHGKRNTPQVRGNSRQPVGVSSVAVPVVPVETDTVTLPVAPEGIVVVAGLNTHFAYVGNVPQANVNVPATPFAGLIVNPKLAVCPAETVKLLDPEIAVVKSKPVPESATLIGADRSGDEIVRAPVAAPLAVGSKRSVAAQPAPEARLLEHVLCEITNGALMARTSEPTE